MASRSIPASIKRQVRQECGFGCVICGMPVFEYDHIEQFEHIKDHTVGNLALLCGTHHNAKSTKKLSADRVREARLNPFNLTRPQTEAFKFEPERGFSVRLGSNTVSHALSSECTSFYALWISGKTYLRIDYVDGWLTPSFAVTDGAGNPLLIVDQGEMKVGTNVYDYRYEGSRLRIWYASKVLFLDMTLSGQLLEIAAGAFLDAHRDGFLVEDGKLLTIVNNEVTACHLNGYYQGGGGAFGIARRSVYDGPRPNFAFFRQVNEDV